MNISIDEDVVKTLKPSENFGKPLTVSEVLLCMIIKRGDRPEQIIQNLLDKGIVVRDEIEADRLLIYTTYSDLIERIIVQSDKAVPKITELDELVTKLQELFPKERKPDSNGVPKYAYRGNKRDVTERLQKFFKLYGQYSYDDVLECTRRYVESFKYDKTYMKILPYFIMKDGESQLATELENMDCDNTSTNNDLNYGEALL